MQWLAYKVLYKADSRSTSIPARIDIQRLPLSLQSMAVPTWVFWLMAARWRGVMPFLVYTFISAPLFKNNLTRSRFCAWQALCSGLNNFSSATLTFNEFSDEAGPWKKVFLLFNYMYKQCISFLHVLCNVKTANIMYTILHSSLVNLFVCLRFFVPLKNFSHMETPQSLVEGCKFWPMLGTHGHWAVRVL